MKKLLLLLLACTPAFAVQEYYSIDRSVRALGMGGAFYGLSNDESAIFYNPAGLATYNGSGRFSLLGVEAGMTPDTISAISTLTSASGQSAGNVAAQLARYQGEDLYGNAGASLLTWQSRNFEIGFLASNAKFNFAMQGAGLDTSVDVTGIDDAGLFVAFAHSFLNDKLFLGVTGKGLARGGGRKTFSVTDLVNQSNNFALDPKTLGGVGVGADFDLGATYELPIPKAGPLLFTRVSFVLNNLLASKFDLVNIAGDPTKIPGLVRMATLAGYSAFEGWGPFDNFNVLLDLAEFSMGGENDPDLGARTGSFFKHVNFGVEAPTRGGWFTPRVGVHQGNITAGLTLDVRVLKIDFATYAEELDSGVGRFSSRRYMGRFILGWGQPPPPVTTKESYHGENDTLAPAPPKEVEVKAQPEKPMAPVTPVTPPPSGQPVAPGGPQTPPAPPVEPKPVPPTEQAAPKAMTTPTPPTPTSTPAPAPLLPENTQGTWKPDLPKNNPTPNQ